jgi:hypothetical protein
MLSATNYRWTEKLLKGGLCVLLIQEAKVWSMMSRKEENNFIKKEKK